MTKAKLTRIPKRVLACVLAVLMVLSCLTMLPFTGFAAPTHVDLESPAIVQDKGTYYAFGNDGKYYSSADMANWTSAGKDYEYLADGAFEKISSLYSHLGTITKTDLDSPEVFKIGNTWMLYLSIMKGNTSMIVRGKSTNDSAAGPYDSFEAVLETGFARGSATDVLQGYIADSYSGNIPEAVENWGKGTCYYFSNILGFNYQWFTEQLPRAYAPSIAYDGEHYWMAYGYRSGGIWMQRLNSDGMIDFTWSGNNWDVARQNGRSYTVADSYDNANADMQRFDPYFGELVVHTTEGGETDSNRSTVSRAGEEPELYYANGKMYLQVSYGGPNNSDGYNVRSYQETLYTVSGINNKIWNFVDMNGTSAVANADDSLMAQGVTRTGLKLMGDYGMYGTNVPADDEIDTYYTSPGASSVVTDAKDDYGLMLYSYQAKLNNADNASAYNTTAQLYSHVLLQVDDGNPLVTPFAFTGDTDKQLYDNAFKNEYDIDEEGADIQVAGQYYVTMSGNETSTSKQSVSGITLTAGHLVSGAISGSWDFEVINVNGHSYPNGIAITGSDGHVYHGALLAQTVENPDTLNGKETTMTFTLADGNQTIWGVRYDDYEPANENNADSGLTVSPAIYTGGALALNAFANGQLGLKYGSYVTALKFANIDYSTYLMIDDNYTITSVVDDNNDGNNGIQFWPVAVGGDSYGDYKDIIDAVFVDRTWIDNNENTDGGTEYKGNVNSDSVNQLVDMLSSKAAEAQQQNKNLYILTGYLDSDTYGRDAHMDNDKGDIVLRVGYTDSENNDAQYTERVYSHVYQQPVPANLSASIYDAKGLNDWFQNAIFTRAEGSYVSDSYLPGRTDKKGIRNTTIADSDGTKTFAAKGIYLWYNPTLFGNNPQYWPGDLGTYGYYHGETTPILKYTWKANINNTQSFNDDYRNTASGADINASYEFTENDENFGNWNYHLAAGPRANYFIDISSPTVSSISDYIADDTVTIPMYYANILTWSSDESDFPLRAKTFNWSSSSEMRYMSGLYSSDTYGVDANHPLGLETGLNEDSNYAFKADFSQVKAAYDNNAFYYPWQSDSANIKISAAWEDIDNERTEIYSTDGSAYQADYNFYVRTKVETADKIDDGHLRLAQDMEYGIYVTDKSYVRNYYDTITAGKYATGITYYSWEAYRDATRLVADYLNNYMELADSEGGDPDGKYNADGKYEQDKKAVYDSWLVSEGRNWTVDQVLKNENGELDQMLSAYPGEVQDVYCYLLNDAVQRLFEYDTYDQFQTAYSEYTMLQEMGNYTTSSWMEYQKYKDQTIKGTDLTFADLAKYQIGAVDDPNVTPDDPTDTSKPIYNPNNSDVEYVNYSWKIINDQFFEQYGMTAKQVFEQATAKIKEAINVLRNKADYTDLDAAMDEAKQMYVNGDTDRQALVGSSDAIPSDGKNLADSSFENPSGDIFAIDSNTVTEMANSENSGQGAGHDTINGQQYTVSSLAAFDKVYASIWELSKDITEGQEYKDLVTEDGVVITDRQPIDASGQTAAYYSNAVRDDQQYFKSNSDTWTDGQSEELSTVQSKIADKTAMITEALNWLYRNAVDNADAYQTFDYLIDVISTIDFSAYTEHGQELLWQKLYELLVEGGVYSVNQQMFSDENKPTENVDTNDPIYKLLYDGTDNNFYTGKNCVDVDAATTELMSLLTDLNDYQRRPVMLNVEVYMTETSDATSADKPYAEQTYDLHYGDLWSVNIKDFITSYSPEDYFAYSWVITTDDATSYLGGLESYDFTAAQDTTLKIYVAEMSNPSAGVDPVRVTVRNRYGGQSNEFVMSLMPETLSAYSVLVSEDGSSLTIMHDGAPIGRTVDAGRVPFYTFKYWTINGKPMQAGETYNLGDITGDAITILSTYEAEDSDFTVTVNGTPTGGFVFDDKVTITADAAPDGQVFYAWIVDDAYNDTDNESDLTDPYSWKIASYNPTYTYLATASERFIQVNTDNDGHYYLQTGDEIPVQPADGVLNATSLYYRLQHKLADSWSNITKQYDTESGKVSLFSHFTDMGHSQARVTEHGIVAITNPSSAGIASNRDLFVIGTQGVNQAVSHTDSSSGQSSGQYVVSIVIPQQALDGRTIYMRSYVTTEYTLDADDLAQSADNDNPLGSSKVFVTNYSEIASVELPGSDAPTTTEDGSTEEE